MKVPDMTAMAINQGLGLERMGELEELSGLIRKSS